MKTPLFNHKANKALEMETNINFGIEETDAKERLEDIMHEALTRVEKLSITSGSSSMAALHEMARKR
jgi:hypothetical protein